jgi:hypothetical protein
MNALGYDVENSFDVCKSRDLTGDQGALVPRVNGSSMVHRPLKQLAEQAKRFRGDGEPSASAHKETDPTRDFD